jgi:hypothetical protein
MIVLIIFLAEQSRLVCCQGCLRILHLCRGPTASLVPRPHTARGLHPPILLLLLLFLYDNYYVCSKTDSKNNAVGVLTGRLAKLGSTVTRRAPPPGSRRRATKRVCET